MIKNMYLDSVVNNRNTGVEYEIALYYRLLKDEDKKRQLLEAIERRDDSSKIHDIIRGYDVSIIDQELKKRNLILEDVSFETQNDDIGPADILLKVRKNDEQSDMPLGISVKYENRCNLNVTGREFLSENQIEKLKIELETIYKSLYIEEMRQLYGEAPNWFRQRRASHVTEEFIDLLRDEVIKNWSQIDKTRILSRLYQMDSPIEFWIVTYKRNHSIELKTNPFPFDLDQADQVELVRHETSFIDFKWRSHIIGRMQVKFNNGFLEKGSTRGSFLVDGISMRIGQPFTSWNFSLMK